MSHLLSKSSYIRGCQCEKSLYLYRHHYEWKDKLSPEQKAIFSRGHKVGELARRLFPGGVDCSPIKFDYKNAIDKTINCINSGVQVIYEACFEYNQTLVLIDILVKAENKWYAYEVKSSTKITTTYIQDASLQYYVIKNILPDLSDIFLVYINNQYIREDKVEIEKLFIIQTVKRNALENWTSIEQNIHRLKGIVESETIPNKDIGTHCYAPYTCDFIGTCWKHIPSNSVFDLTEMSMNEKMSFYDKGLMYFSDLVKVNELKPSHKIQIDTALNNRPHTDVKALKEYLSDIHYPLFFLDVEAFMPAVPLFKRNKPYQHLPFLFSTHKKISKDATIEHIDFIAETGIDPRKQFARALIEAHQGAETILIYDAKMENQIINALKNEFPELRDSLQTIQNKIKDLIIPFENKWYYTKNMKGSNSLKNVASSIDAEIDFGTLIVSHGTVALSQYEELQTETDLLKILETRDALREYCKMDTWAMVKVYEKLLRVAGL